MEDDKIGFIGSTKSSRAQFENEKLDEVLSIARAPPKDNKLKKITTFIILGSVGLAIIIGFFSIGSYFFSLIENQSSINNNQLVQDNNSHFLVEECSLTSNGVWAFSIKNLYKTSVTVSKVEFVTGGVIGESSLSKQILPERTAFFNSIGGTPTSKGAKGAVFNSDIIIYYTFNGATLSEVYTCSGRIV